jgi:hypothetical protein
MLIHSHAYLYVDKRAPSEVSVVRSAGLSRLYSQLTSRDADRGRAAERLAVDIDMISRAEMTSYKLLALNSPRIRMARAHHARSPARIPLFGIFFPCAKPSKSSFSTWNSGVTGASNQDARSQPFVMGFVCWLLDIAGSTTGGP